MAKTDYIRDGRSPIPKSVTISRVMSANRSRDTKPEILLRQALRKVGIPGYRLHWKKAPGRPDISYPSKKVAIFVHGCYWHRCPYCKLPLPKSNKEFWKGKFFRNKKRDKRKVASLKKEGWKIFTFWECEIKKNAFTLAKKVRDYVKAH